MVEPHIIKKHSRDWRRLNYFVPITQSVKSDSGKFLISGVAINATTTRNGVKFIEEELNKSASSLQNKPILKNHDNMVESIVGRTTTNVFYDAIAKNVKFEGEIIDELMQQMISDGRICSVSVGAMVQSLEPEDPNNMKSPVIARGIDFVEISLVAVPADPDAGFAAAIAESFKMKIESQEEFITESLNVLDNHPAAEEQEKINAEKVSEQNLGGKLQMDEKEKADYEAKIAELSKANAANEAKLLTIHEKEMAQLKEEYRAECAAKGVTVRQDLDKLSRESVEMLVSTLKDVKVSKPEATTPVKTKGLVQVEEAGASIENMQIMLEKSEVGTGVSFYATNLAEKSPRMSRNGYSWDANEFSPKGVQ